MPRPYPDRHRSTAARPRRRLHPVIAATLRAPPPRQHGGRPSGEPRTQLGRWLRALELSVPVFTGCLVEIAKRQRLPPAWHPKPKTVGGVVGGWDTPGMPLAYLIHLATSGDVDLEHWVKEALARN